MMRSLTETKTFEMMGRLSIDLMKYAAALSTRYIAPIGMPNTATSNAAIKMLARIASVTSRQRLLPLLVDKDNIKFSTTSSAKGVNIRPRVSSFVAGRHLLCQLCINITCAAFRSAVRDRKNPFTAFMGQTFLLQCSFANDGSDWLECLY